MARFGRFTAAHFNPNVQADTTTGWPSRRPASRLGPWQRTAPSLAGETFSSWFRTFSRGALMMARKPSCSTSGRAAVPWPASTFWTPSEQPVSEIYNLSFIIYHFLNQQHGVPVAEKTVAPLHRLAVGPEDELPPARPPRRGKRAHQHEQGRACQVEIGEERVNYFKLEGR